MTKEGNMGQCNQSHDIATNIQHDSSNDSEMLPIVLHVPTLMGEILQLQPASLQDLDRLDEIGLFTSENDHSYPESLTRAFIKRCIQESLTWNSVNHKNSSKISQRTIAWTIIALDPSFDIIGMAFLTQISTYSQSANLHIFLRKEYQHRGYLHDAIPHLLSYIFASQENGLGLHRISVVLPATDNRSIALLQSFGFFKEGILRDSLWDNESNIYRDQVLLAILSGDYMRYLATASVTEDNLTVVPGEVVAISESEKDDDNDQQDNKNGWVFPLQWNRSTKSEISKRAWWRKKRKAHHESDN